MTQEKIPRMNDGIEHSEKFIQIYVDNEPYFRHANCEWAHPEILEKFIRKWKYTGKEIISTEELRESKKTTGHPPLEAGRYRSTGMGHCTTLHGLVENLEDLELQIEKPDVIPNKLIVWGESHTYHISPDIRHLEAINSVIPDWEIVLSEGDLRDPEYIQKLLGGN